MTKVVKWLNNKRIRRDPYRGTGGDGGAVPTMIWHFARLALGRPGSLTGQVIHGGIWLVGGDICAKGLNFLKIIILARLLSPDDFGRVAVAVAVLSGLDNCTQPGLRNALIQTKADISRYLDAVWTFQVLRGMGLALIIASGAPLVAKFFGNPDVVPILRVLTIITISRGLTNPATVLLRKNLQLRREVIWRLVATTAGVIAAIVWGIWYRNAWALVISFLVMQLTETGLSYWIIPYRPRGSLDLRRVGSLMKWGKWYFWLQLASYVTLVIDLLAVGKILGVGQAGLYQVALQIAKEPIAQLGSHVHGVMFPAFAKLHKKEDLHRGVIQSLTVVSAIVIPLGGGIAVIGGLLVEPVLGEAWAPIAPLVSILVWAGVATAVGRVIDALLQGVGRPDLSLWFTLVNLVGLTVSIYPMAKFYGLIGVSITVMGAQFLATFVALSRGVQLVGTSNGEMLRVVVRAGISPFRHIRRVLTS